jgi:hypothetical protein
MAMEESSLKAKKFRSRGKKSPEIAIFTQLQIGMEGPPDGAARSPPPARRVPTRGCDRSPGGVRGMASRARQPAWGTVIARAGLLLSL